MKKIFILIISAFLLAPSFAQLKLEAVNASPTTANENPYHEADSLMTYGEDTERDKQSLAISEKALASDGNNYQWLWRVARASYLVGDNSAKPDKIRYFEQGINTGQRAVAQEAGAVEGHFWLAANYGGLAEQKGAFSALRLVKKVRAGMETVLRLNDRYENGSAYLALGEMDRQLPRIIGGNLDRAISRLENGLRVAPANLEIKLALAYAYQEAKRKEEARRQLQEIVNSQPDPSRLKADRNVQEKARQLFAKL